MPKICGCGVELRNHPKCQACKILVCSEYTYSIKFRRKNLCGLCIEAWLGLDKRVGRKTTWEEFLDPTQIRGERGERWTLKIQ